MLVFLELGLLFAAVFLAVYVSYFLFVLRTKKKKQYMESLRLAAEEPIALDQLPEITVLIPAYNEEKTIRSKIKNISEFAYPRQKVEVLIMDDQSTDRTSVTADSAFIEFGVRGRIIVNDVRSGVNASYNRGIPEADSEYILTTDADALIPPDSPLKAVKVLMKFRDVGAVAARMIPISNETTSATRAAVAYSDSYNSMLIAESALSSTFPGSTSCMMMRKSAFSPLSTSYGSSDGNLSLSIIRNGFRYILAPEIAYNEPISERLFEQRRQKIRRAARLIQSIFLNTDMLFKQQYGEFGKKIFPLRFLMMTLCPVLLFFSVILLMVFAFSSSVLIFAVLVSSTAAILTLGARTDIKMLNLLTSFCIHQAYVFAGLLLSSRKMTVWKGIERRSQTIGVSV
jgi:cellulose synthase/poly-beta-1,6-N-acetylglucosamine synthase-like glycosyltransferase